MSWIQNTHTLEVYRRYNAKQCKWFFFRGIGTNVRKWEKTDIPICLRIINVNKSFSAIVYCHFDFRMPVSWKDDGQLRLTWNINKKTTTNEMSDIKSTRKNTVKGFSINLLYSVAAVAMPIAIFELAFTENLLLLRAYVLLFVRIIIKFLMSSCILALPWRNHGSSYSFPESEWWCVNVWFHCYCWIFPNKWWANFRWTMPTKHICWLWTKCNVLYGKCNCEVKRAFWSLVVVSFVGFQLCRCLYFDFRLDQILSAFQPTQQPHSENHNWSTQQIFRNTKFRTCFHSFYSFVFELNFAYIVILTFVELAKQLWADIWQCM